MFKHTPREGFSALFRVDMILLNRNKSGGLSGSDKALIINLATLLNDKGN